MIDYRLIEALAAVLDEGGFERAADRLGITQSAVSQRIRALEEEMGRILVIRETPPRATPSGERLLRHYRQVAALEKEAIADLGVSVESEFQRVPIAVNADSLSTWFLDSIHQFLLEEKLTVEIFVEDQEKTLRLLRAGTAACCVASERLNVQGFSSTKIGALRYRLVAAPEFSRRWFAGGFDRGSAAKAPIIHFNRDDQLQYRSLFRIFGKPQVSPPAHYIPSTEKLADAVLAGLGYAMLPEVQAVPEIERKRLVELDSRGRLDTPLYWYRWNRQSELLERMSETILAHGKRILGSPVQTEQG